MDSSGVTDGGHGASFAPGKLKVNTGPSFVDLLIFIILVFSRLVLFLRFLQVLSFFSANRHPRHPDSL